MCGLTGFWQPGGIEADAARAQVTAMAERLQSYGRFTDTKADNR